jgi:hypothetical protein
MRASVSQSGGVSHYTVQPDAPGKQGTEIVLNPPSEAFRNFVRNLGFNSVAAAVELGQFQHQLEQTLKDEVDQRG